jgi:transposase
MNVFSRKGLSWPLSESLNDDDLNRIICQTEGLPFRREIIQPDYLVIHQELKKKGVTLQLLWEEYYAIHGDKSYGRSQFCEHYCRWLPKKLPLKN